MGFATGALPRTPEFIALFSIAVCRVGRLQLATAQPSATQNPDIRSGCSPALPYPDGG